MLRRSEVDSRVRKFLTALTAEPVPVSQAPARSNA